MSSLFEWLTVAVLAAVFNITPLFAPPTMGLLAYFHINNDMNIFLLAILGGFSAASGKLLLGLASRRFGGRLVPASRRASLERTIDALGQKRSAGLAYLAMFVVGPIPKGTLFAAAGLANLPLLPGAIAFGVTRTIVYLGALLVADTAATSLESLFGMSVVGPLGIAVQLGSLVAIVLLIRTDWGRMATRFAALKRLPVRIRSRLSPARASD